MLDIEDIDDGGAINELHALITTRTHEFSNESIHIPGKEVRTEYSKGDELENIYGLKIFANGWPRTNRGYVSVTFYSKYADLPCVGHCIISVIDASGNKRFSQTCIFDDKKNREDKYIQYISRATLLSDPDEYLPNDVLTLEIDTFFFRSKYTIKDRSVNIKQSLAKLDERYVREREKISQCFTCILEPLSARKTWKFDLDSPLAKCLAEESLFFRAMLNTPMLEQSTKTMIVDEKEYETFFNIGLIVMENRELEFRSVEEIFDLYILADKYDIPYVKEVCTGFLKLCLWSCSVDDYLEIANGYKIESVRELIIKAISLVGMTDLKEETKDVAYGVYLKQPIRKCIWMLRKTMRGSPFVLRFEIIDESKINWYAEMELVTENE